MITRIEAMNFRCLRQISQALHPFHVLVGPNASGKSTFLDVVAFLARLLADGLEPAVQERSQSLYDLVWGRKAGRFELAVEANIPEEHQPPWDAPEYERIRYELAVGIDGKSGELAILQEQLALGPWVSNGDRPDTGSGEPLSTLFTSESSREWKTLIHRLRPRKLDVTPEQHVDERGQRSDADYWLEARHTPKKAIFDQLPVDHFPASTWLAESVSRGVNQVELDSRALRRPSPPGKGIRLAADGSNLPWVVTNLQENASSAFADWVAHLRTGLPDLDAIRVVERLEDKHRYLLLRYHGGLEVPSWILSDGTLRLLALTALAYTPHAKPICLIEEPENSIHPLNIETVMQSLRSVYDGQVLVATHSPILLAMTDVSDILVFAESQPESLYRPVLREAQNDAATLVCQAMNHAHCDGTNRPRQSVRIRPSAKACWPRTNVCRMIPCSGRPTYGLSLWR